MNFKHDPVMARRAVEFLDMRGKTGGMWVDATLGRGGHSGVMLDEISDGNFIVGIDCDTDNLKRAEEKFRDRGNFKAVYGNFRELGAILKNEGIKKIEGILYDLGASSPHFDDAGRGFSFSKDGPLDMRFDRSAGLSAYEVVNNYREKDLAYIIKKYGEEPFCRRIARAIVKKRPIKGTLELASVVAGVKRGRGRIHPATKVFQAIRIEVNDELNALAESLQSALGFLKKGGRIVAISFHSLEDRIVKNFFALESKDCICDKGVPVCTCGHIRKIKVVTKKPLIPDEAEAENNPRARSAKLRAAEKI